METLSLHQLLSDMWEKLVSIKAVGSAQLGS